MSPCKVGSGHWCSGWQPCSLVQSESCKAPYGKACAHASPTSRSPGSPCRMSWIWSSKSYLSDITFQVQNVKYSNCKVWKLTGREKKINSFLSKWCPGSTAPSSVKMISQTESDQPEAVKLDNVIGFNIKGHSIPGPIISISGDTGPSKFFNHLLIFKREKVELDHCPGVSPN